MKAELIVDAPIVDQKRIWVKKIRQAYFDHPFHYHPVCELTWVIKGYGKLIVGDYVGNFSEGELIFKNEGLPHLWRCDKAFYEKNNSLQTKAIAIYFPPTIIQNMTDDTESISLLSNTLKDAARGLRFYGKTKINIIEKIKRINGSTSTLEQLGIFLQIIDIMTKTMEFDYLAGITYKATYNRQDMERFNAVYEFLLQNFKQDILLDKIASICNMTPSSFCRFFKAKTQKTLTRFLNELRIGHACKLLHNKNETVQNICYESGYNSPVNFFKFFKQITGKTPLEYRNCIRNIDAE